MKKVLFIAFILCSTIQTTNAQDSALPEKFKTGDMVFVVRTGPAINGVTGSGVDDMKTNWAAANCNGEFKNTFGWNASIGMYAPLSQLYFGTILTFGMRGYQTSAKWKEGTSTINSQESKLTTFNAQVSPLNLGYVIDLSPTTALDIHAGSYFAFDFAGSLSTDIEYSNGKSEHTSEGINSIDGYKKFEIGLAGGIGLWYKRWGVDLSYQRGLIKMYDSDSFYSTSLQLSVGYAF